MLIYVSGPLFSEAEPRSNLDLTEKLGALDFRVFLSFGHERLHQQPQQHTVVAMEALLLL